MLSNIFPGKKPVKRKAISQVNELTFCELEARQLLAITFASDTGLLEITGTWNPDVATVTMVDSDTVRATLNDDTQDFDLSDIQSIAIYGYGDSDLIQNQTSIPSTIYGGNGNDYIEGGSGNDFLVGDIGNDTVLGQGGNDTIIGKEGGDNLFGGDGDDSIYGKDGWDSISGDAGDDFLAGEGGWDELDGGDGNDRISGGEGVDSIFAGAGDDLAYGGDDSDDIFGGAGNDRLLGLDGDDFIYGGLGDDTLGGGNDDDNVEGNEGNDFVSGNRGNDVVRGGDGNDSVYGGHEDDELYGDAGVDLLAGGWGDDYLEGGDGEDLIVGDAGNDELHGGGDNDNLFGGAGVDLLTGGEGADKLSGNAGDDEIHGGDGDDDVYGGDGNDRLFGEAGIDILRGESGNDAMFGGVDAGDRIKGGAGSDRFMTSAGDTMIDRADIDAQIEFRNETSDWTEAEVKIIDDGLAWLQEQAGTNLVNRDSLDVDPVVYSKWADLNGAAGINSLTTYWNSVDGYSYEREILFLEWDETSDFYNNEMTKTAIHEVAHSWDSAAEINNVLNGSGNIWTEYLVLSSWTETNPNSSDFAQSHDGQWWYDEDSAFAYDYGRTNPYEDWATMFEAAYEASDGEADEALASKVAMFNELMEVFQQA